MARRFNIDQPYFHDIIESCEGPLKVWSKGEKLEHDIFWQQKTAGRYAKRLTEAYNADITTENTFGSNKVGVWTWSKLQQILL